MVRQCVVCKRSEYSNPGLIFRRFPVNLQRRTRWISLLDLDNKHVKKYAQICSNHFDESDIINTKITRRRRIRPNAEPQLNNPVFTEPLPFRSSHVGSPNLEFHNLSEVPVDKNIAGPSNLNLLKLNNDERKSLSPSTDTENASEMETVINCKDEPQSSSSDLLEVESFERQGIHQINRKRKRYIGDLESSDFPTPEKSRKHLNVVKSWDKKRRAQVHSLQMTVRRLRMRITSMQQLIDYLKQKSLITESSESTIKMSSASVGTHSGAGPLSLMSCVRESSPLQDYEPDIEKNVSSKRRFWNPKKWFRRKNKVSDDVVVLDVTETSKDSLRSRSTSELSDADEGRRRSSSSMHPGLSVSHDSVFHSPNSGSDMELDAAQSSSSLSICQPHVDSRLQTELIERLRVRRGRGDVSEDDEGFPHSSCNSPTASDGLLLDKTAIKDLPTKSHSTCSDGSLLSMGSYEMDEDSSDPQSRNSSKLSLHEKKQTTDTYSEFEPTVAPLNHSAAHHRVSVKPKRTHGAPRRKRVPQLSTALPVTPEVNEDSSIRSISPDSNKKDMLTELYSMSTTRTLTELKCSSLPPGLTAPGSDTTKLNRSKSNAGSNSQDAFSTVHEDAEKEEKLSLFDRIFPRKSARKKKQKEEKESESTEKRQEIHESATERDSATTTSTNKSFLETSSTLTTTTSKCETSKPIPAPRSGPASRQRILPMDIPSTPDEIRKETNIISPKPPPEKSLAGTSPLQAELETRFKQKQISLSTSPSATAAKQSGTPPLSPRISKPTHSPILPTVISSKLEYSTLYSKSSSNTTKYTETRPKNEEFRSKMKLPGLSSLQQRVLSLNDDVDNGFKSLTDFPDEHVKETKPLTKSQSFKSTKKSSFESDNIVEDNLKIATADFLSKEKKEDNRISFTKASSLDSVKNLDDQKIHLSEMKLELKRSKPDLKKRLEPNKETKTDTRNNENSNSSEIFSDSSITISGPSHTAVVNVTSNKEDFAKKTHSIETGIVDGSQTISIKEHQVSITKIQVKQEMTQVTQNTVVLPKSAVPEFWNKQLNKVEARPASNIILSMKSPKIIEEQNRPKTLFNFDTAQEVVNKPSPLRKFSKENLEIIEKTAEDERPPKTPPVTSPTTIAFQTPRFRKNENKNTRKSSLVPTSPDTSVKDKLFKSRSSSLDSLKSDINEASDKSSQDSLDKLDNTKDKGVSMESVVLRKKSIPITKKDDEPELMKVFARRSLKIKDSDIDSLQENLSDSKTRDSDKENQIDSPVDDTKTFLSKTDTEILHRKYSTKEKTEDNVEVKSCVKEPLAENKTSDASKTNATGDSPVMIRRTINNNVFLGQRTVSLNPAISISSELKLKKQSSFCERRKVGQWITSMNNDEADLKDNIIKDDIINNISPKSDFITEPKNFNQRKAEWEKRAQMAQKKNTP